jgi:hypothetical protein
MSTYICLHGHECLYLCIYSFTYLDDKKASHQSFFTSDNPERKESNTSQRSICPKKSTFQSIPVPIPKEPTIVKFSKGDEYDDEDW